jgi:membrane-associated phospholipid phosphatase
MWGNLMGLRHWCRRVGVARLAITQIALLTFVPLLHAQTLPVARFRPLPDKTTATLPDPGRFEDVDISWRKLPKRILRDQKDIWLFPTQLARGHYWLPTLAVVGGTAGLIAADPHAVPFFRSHGGNLDDLNDVFDGNITNAAIAVAPLSILIAGYIRHDSYAVKTALLAGEAYADGAIVDLALKGITRRKRPSGVASGAPFNDTFFRGGTSFPSGHATAAFSVATIIARRYRDHRWVPWAAYGVAVAISLSRVTTTAHFPSDVFLGAALGYTIARFDVLR